MAPHAPQFWKSVARSTQLIPQGVSPVAHSAAQAPSEQCWPVAHAAAQAPQWIGSEARSTQSVPHRDKPVRQAQLAAAHSCCALQALPQVPQLRLSVCTSTHPAGQ
jgi:hypothetical protein